MIVTRRRSMWPQLCNLTSAAAVVVLLAGMPVIAQVDEGTRRAAEQGLATAQLNLGIAYRRGEGVPQNHREAVRWFRLAAEQGNTSVQYNLGVAYTHGEGVPQNHREAIRWFRRAAATQGLPGAAAQNNLGVAYTRGEGVPQDYLEAARWFRLAAEQHDTSTEEGRGRRGWSGSGQARHHLVREKDLGCCPRRGTVQLVLQITLNLVRGDSERTDFEHGVHGFVPVDR